MHNGAITIATTQQFCTLANRLVKPLLHSYCVGFANQRPDVGAFSELVSCGELFDLGLERFEQVIMNLATNGRDAMPDGGKITISTRNIEFSRADLVVSSLAEFVTLLKC